MNPRVGTPRRGVRAVWGWAAPLLTIALLVPAAATGASLVEAGLRHSHVALMPEGEPESIDVLRPLHPDVVAWGADAVDTLSRPSVLKTRMDSYRALGVGLLACNVWMLTATPRVLHDDPRFQDAVCRDFDGEPIVPRWLDDEYEGVQSYWGCTNHPLFREQLIARAVAGIAAGANLLHLDDHLGTAAAAEHSGGCFCDHCVKGFAVWLRAHHPIGEHANGDSDYRATLHTAGLTTRAQYEAALRDGNVPLRAEFLAFQREAAIEFVRELGRIAATTAGRPVPVGVNAWNLAPTQLATAHVADYFANEISQYGVEDLEPPRAYLLAEALGKPVFGTGTGEDWIKVMEHGDVIRVRRWIATAQAFGQHFMYAYRKWGFSKETGTRWYETPIDTFAPVFRFISQNPALFDEFEAAPQVGVLYDNRARRAGKGDVSPIVRALHDAHYSVNMVVVGDEWLQHPFDAARVARCELLIIPPDVEFEIPQGDALDAWRRQNRTIQWSGIEAVRSRVKPWIDLQGAGRVWTLPRVRHRETSSQIVVHLLNQNQAADRDAMIATGPFRVTIGRGLLHGQPVVSATLFAPSSPPQALAVKPVADGWELTVPTLDLWAVLELE